MLDEDNMALVDQLGATVCFQLEMPEANYHESPLAGFVIGDGKRWLVSRNADLLTTAPLKKLLEDPAVEKDVFNAKAQLVGLHRLGVDLAGVDFDLLLASYLLNTSENANDLGVLAAAHDYHQVQTDEEVYGKGAKRAIPADDEVFFTHLAKKARAIRDLKEPLYQQLTDNEQLPLYEDIERPLSAVLAHMEITGIHVDAATLKEMGSKLVEREAELEQAIYQEAGEEFNINSPKQLGVILFEKMKLPVIKKTKTGYSTAVDVLEKLADRAPIVQDILAYRQINLHHRLTQGDPPRRPKDPHPLLADPNGDRPSLVSRPEPAKHSGSPGRRAPNPAGLYPLGTGVEDLFVGLLAG